MKRVNKTLSLGNGLIRYVTRIETDYCEVNTPEYQFFQFEIFKAIANDPSLVATGPKYFDTGKIFHDGEHWVFELQSDVKP